MRADELEAACLALPGAGKEYPFGDGIEVFKVRGKIFAIGRLGGDPPTISLRCEPDLAVQLRAQHAAINPGWHLNKRHWNTVTVDGSLPAASAARADRGLLRPRRREAAETSARGAALARRLTAAAQDLQSK